MSTPDKLVDNKRCIANLFVSDGAMTILGHACCCLVIITFWILLYTYFKWSPLPKPPDELSTETEILHEFHKAVQSGYSVEALMPYVKAMPRLTGIKLCGSAVTDAQLESLTTLTHLEYLNLNRTGITDAGLVHITELTQLRFLYCDQTQITGLDFAWLERLTSLEALVLSNSKLTDRSVEHLAARLQDLPKLQSLELFPNPGVSDSTCEEFEQLLDRRRGGKRGHGTTQTP